MLSASCQNHIDRGPVNLRKFIHEDESRALSGSGHSLGSTGTVERQDSAVQHLLLRIRAETQYFRRCGIVDVERKFMLGHDIIEIGRSQRRQGNSRTGHLSLKLVEAV